MDEGENARGTIFRDIRRYYCEYCGICRSKKALIASHILSEHQDELKQKGPSDEKDHEAKLNTCEECGASFRKPAHLKQHMQSHSFDRPFACPVDDCNSSYRRKDHLARHLLQHQGKLFECPVEGCKSRFTVHGNVTRHRREFHDESKSAKEEELLPKDCEPKECVCSEPGCGKVFNYPCKLRKHEDSHVKVNSVEALCAEPGCLKYFSNEKCLREHIGLCHQYIVCDKCGTNQLRKNMKRHLRLHEGGVCTEKLKCDFDGCNLSFSTMSNRNQHVKAVHLGLKPFKCSISGCPLKFAFKHVRDNHEKSGCHAYTPGNFEESDEQFRSRPRGGRKRKYPSIESLTRKRVLPPNESGVAFEHEPEHPSWLSSSSESNE